MIDPAAYRFRFPLRRKIQIVAAPLILLAALIFTRFLHEPARQQAYESERDARGFAVSVTSTPSAVTTTNAFVMRAVDGDTLLVKIDGQNEEAKIRLLGVNTPESVDPRRPVQCFGKEASKFTAGLVDRERVRLDPDPLADERDKYDRLLRNVILSDGTDLNARLVRDGYAYAYLSFPMNPARKAELRRLQAEAKNARRGLWDPHTCGGEK